MLTSAPVIHFSSSLLKKKTQKPHLGNVSIFHYDWCYSAKWQYTLFDELMSANDKVLDADISLTSSLSGTNKHFYAPLSTTQVHFMIWSKKQLFDDDMKHQHHHFQRMAWSFYQSVVGQSAWNNNSKKILKTINNLPWL